MYLTYFSVFTYYHQHDYHYYISFGEYYSNLLLSLSFLETALKNSLV